MKIDYEKMFPDMREENSNLTKLRQIQLVELRMLKIFDDICRRNGIGYSIVTGKQIGRAHV